MASASNSIRRLTRTAVVIGLLTLMVVVGLGTLQARPGGSASAYACATDDSGGGPSEDCGQDDPGDPGPNDGPAIPQTGWYSDSTIECHFKEPYDRSTTEMIDFACGEEDQPANCKAAHPGDDSWNYTWFWRQWRVYTPDGTLIATGLWEWTGGACVRGPLPTPGQIRERAKQLLPKGKPVVQPANGRTLVNLKTNFMADTSPYSKDNPWTHEVTLAGYTIRLQATPEVYEWSFGDGAGIRTGSPGHPYPRMDLLHTYTKTADNLQVSFTGSWRVTYQIEDLVPNGSIPGLVEAFAAPATDLDVVDLRQVLSD